MKDYLIMSRDIPVGLFENNEYKTLNATLEPLFFKYHRDFSLWLRERAIDAGRTNSRILKRILKLTDKNDEEIAIKSHAAKITDTYWIKEPDSDLAYSDIAFKNNLYAMTALNGDTSTFDISEKSTPELTNTGSFEKCWMIHDGAWHMYKKASINSAFSEIFISRLGLELGMNCVKYFYDAELKSVFSKDFTNAGTVCLEEGAGFLSKQMDFAGNYDFFRSFRRKIADDYASLLYLDCICMNVDRHLNNLGLLRNPETGDVIALAPNYDNNIALLYNKNNIIHGPSNVFTEDYKDFFAAKKEFPEMYASKLPEAIKKAYIKTIDEIENVPDIPFEKLSDFILRSADKIFDSKQKTNNIEIANER